ncbi:MAG: hybrid sensor histidine kinase/response regulator [Verrucomicrobiales bacterium]|nr:hybrid sensor histidine kinase/response regulator [Verrucomicrobiales bacterium]
MNDFHVVEAENGLEGVEVAQRQLPDLILCDVHMPELDGFGALARLRNTANTAAIPFIFLTGLSEKPLMRQGMELGADDYLTKPFTLQELIAAVRTRLDKKAVLAQQAEKKLEELRGNISMALPHELLTPIAGILGFSSILLEDGASMRREEVEEAASNIHQAAVRLRRTIENFLLYSQIELVAADPLRVAAVREGRHSHRAESMAQWARDLARRVGREADLRLQLEAAVLPISSEKLEKLICELLDNAFKFSDPGSEVLLSTITRDGNFVLGIEDRGRGLTPEQVRKIGAHMQFERKFYEQQGSGLGLVITKRLTELHGGQMQIESTPGQSTKVQVTMPIA